MQSIRTLCWPLIFLGIVLLAGCAAKTQHVSQGTERPYKFLLFQKTPCYGTCPAYNATFYTDGSILYEGFRYVPVEDTLQLQLTKAQLQALRASINQLNYPLLQSSYLASYTDVPSSYLTFYEDNRERKRVKHQQGGPEALQRLITSLHEQVMQLVEAKAQDKQ